MVVATVPMVRQVQVISLIGFGHFLSHLYQLALIPLIEFIRADLSISYIEFGTAIAVYSVATAVLQTPVGFLVDRIGGRWILTAGLFLNGAAIAATGVATEFWQFLALMTLAGVGNSVFHPADYALLSSSVEKTRLGRAIAIHAFGGTSGFMVAPILMVFLASLWGWRDAVIFVGLVGIGLACLNALVGGVLQSSEAAAERAAIKAAGRPGWRSIATRPMIMFFVFFVLSAGAGSGVSTFAIPALVQIYGMTASGAADILSLFYAMTASGILLGGYVADKSRRHDIVLLVTYTLSTICLIVIGSAQIPVWLVVGSFVIAGITRGIVNPSRDVLVRRAAPPGSIGAVFGFVTTGFSIGQVVAPLFYGWLMDQGQPEMVFWTAAAFTVAAIAIVLISRERGLYVEHQAGQQN